MIIFLLFYDTVSNYKMNIKANQIQINHCNEKMIEMKLQVIILVYTECPRSSAFFYVCIVMNPSLCVQ